MKYRLTTNCLTVVMNLYIFSLTIYMLAVGCEHTGYKFLMAGLVTEWIYDAFAVWSFFLYTLLVKQTLWTHQPSVDILSMFISGL